MTRWSRPWLIAAAAVLALGIVWVPAALIWPPKPGHDMPFGVGMAVVGWGFIVVLVAFAVLFARDD